MIITKLPFSEDYLFDDVVLKKLPFSEDYEFQDLTKQRIIKKPFSNDYTFESLLYGNLDIIKQPLSNDYKIGNFNIIKQPFSEDYVIEVSPNLISNGNFHIAGAGGADVFANWGEVTSGTSTVNDDTSDFVNNGHSCRQDIDASSNYARVYQDVNVEAGETYILSFYAKSSDAAKHYEWAIQEKTGGSDWWNNVTGQWQSAYAPNRGSETTYTLLGAAITIQPGVSRITINLNRKSPDASFSIWYDRMSLRKIS